MNTPINFGLAIVLVAFLALALAVWISPRAANNLSAMLRRRAAALQASRIEYQRVYHNYEEGM